MRSLRRMADPNYTHIEFLLDKSGSMYNKINAVINGYNEFLSANQTVPGRLTCSMRQFDTVYEDTYTMVEGQGATQLCRESFVPRGGTALVDAAVDAIDRLGDQLEALPEQSRPGKVVFVVYTDGEENSSQYHSGPELSARIKEQEELYKWEFVYLGAHPNAFGEAGNLGFDLRKVGGYQNSAAGMTKGFQEATNSVLSYRSGRSKEVLIGSSK